MPRFMDGFFSRAFEKKRFIRVVSIKLWMKPCQGYYRCFPRTFCLAEYKVQLRHEQVKVYDAQCFVGIGFL